MCFFDYHNDAMFGLCKSDMTLVAQRKSDWKKPSEGKKKENQKFMKESVMYLEQERNKGSKK